MSEAVAAAPGRRWAGRDTVTAGEAVRFGAWPATLAIGGAVLMLFLLFAGYGYNLEDEGTVLYQILRTHRGERPYLDVQQRLERFRRLHGQRVAIRDFAADVIRQPAIGERHVRVAFDDRDARRFAEPPCGCVSFF